MLESTLVTTALSISISYATALIHWRAADLTAASVHFDAVHPREQLLYCERLPADFMETGECVSVSDFPHELIIICFS